MEGGGAQKKTYVDSDGITMEWDEAKGAYFPKVDETLVWSYQQTYPGVDQGAPDWTAHTDAEGRTYYYNKRTQQSSWERPAALDANRQPNQAASSAQAAAAAAASAASTEAASSAGAWSEHTDPGTGTTYYYNTVTKQSSWVKPEALQPAPKQDSSADGEQSDKKKKRTRGKRRHEDDADKVKIQDGKKVVIDDSANCHVYVSGLPLDVTLEEFDAFMSKAGIINQTDNGEKRIKLYYDELGHPKGDGKCSYLRVESVQLALSILHDSEMRDGFKPQIQRAVFQLKEGMELGKKKEVKKRTKAGGKSLSQKMLHWYDLDTKSKKAQGVMVLKHMFTLDEVKADPTLLYDLKEDVGKECSKFGPIKKLEIFDSNPEGVIKVKFTDEGALGPAIATLNGRWFGGQKIVAEEWDGKTKYKMNESEKDEEERMRQWEDYLNDDDIAAASE